MRSTFSFRWLGVKLVNPVCMGKGLPVMAVVRWDAGGLCKPHGNPHDPWCHVV